MKLNFIVHVDTISFDLIRGLLRCLILSLSHCISCRRLFNSVILSI